jgi:hypothetical protein
LQALSIANVPTHLLLGIPEQLPLEYTDRLFHTLDGASIDLIDNPGLACDATLPNEVIRYLEDWAANTDLTATSLTYKLKCN